VVPGGVASADQSRWIASRSDYFLPLKVLSCVFRGKFVDGLRRMFRSRKLVFHGSCVSLAQEKAFKSFVRSLHREEWVVYAKPPFGGPEQCSSTWHVTPTALPSRITGCCL